MTELSRYERDLKNAGLRITQPRRIILQILEQSGDHPDATEIFQRAAKMDARISLATVYRTMKVLEETGAVERHAFQGGPARFEQADREHHDHLIDIETGAVVEFTSPRIEELQRTIAEELGYEIVDHRLELYGRKIR
ncbi:Fur family transcriptional regulator, ferric uptake regulator [Monaibacterium marinum]|uniref:Ferric uptake regulation protein n=1 Tax=Pontivivens marinum TaxID=1690039 RepID=A0A2C9CNA5_9RHOB|nr:Fur family transcriptional regulator [Monaibacterium marinum]SOH92876.1 Fur family transcriptional regulator, ferric uptake regulator [Monaibacterium marinum]